MSFIKKYALCPVDKSKILSFKKEEIEFENGLKYPIVNGKSILYDEKKSLFSIKDIESKVNTTQNKTYDDNKNIKNLIRKNLPHLSSDDNIEKRYSDLKKQSNSGPILIIGAGNKILFYKNIFGDDVILSDVHLLYDCDIVFDTHQIPFADESMSLIILPQVLEHVHKPWIVARELERVIKSDGKILIEVPFGFPIHSYYDFFRYTPRGIESLFENCDITNTSIPMGNWSTAAIALENALIDSFSHRYLRIISLFLARIFFWWFKYLDQPRKLEQSFARGYSFELVKK